MTTSESKIFIKAQPVSKIDIRNISFNKEKIDKMVDITVENDNDEESQLLFQTPYLEVSQPLTNTAFQNISQLETVLRGDNEKNMQDFLTFANSLEEATFNHVEKYGNAWFNTPNVQMKPLIRDANGEKFIKWPIQLRPDTNIFTTQDGSAFDFNTLKVGDVVKFLVLIPGLWVNDNQFGYAIMVEKIRVKPFTMKPIVEYIFDDIEEEEDVDDNNDLISALATECNTSTRKKLNLDKKRNDKFSKPSNAQMMTPLETINDDKTVMDLLDTKRPRAKQVGNGFPFSNKEVTVSVTGKKSKAKESLDNSRSYDENLTCGSKQVKSNKKHIALDPMLALSLSDTTDSDDENFPLRSEKQRPSLINRYKE